MKVAADVKNIDGMLLIPTGCELTDRQIGILQAWGVTEIEVQATGNADGTEDPLAKLPPEVLANLTAELKALFWQPDESNPAYLEIFKLMLRRRAQRVHAK
jgi:hypothetical protein